MSTATEKQPQNDENMASNEENRNTMAVAIPRINDQLHALNDVGWYASSYLLTTYAFPLLYGKLCTTFQVKGVFLTAFFMFELGSLICGVAPNSTTLIVGRAVAELGSAGIFSGALITLMYIAELDERPIFLGMFGGMYGIASVAELLGFFLELDSIGTLIFVPAILYLLLALQWGGVTYDWSDVRIITLFVVFGAAIIGFITLKVAIGDKATVPVRIARQRNIAFCSFFGLCVDSSSFLWSTKFLSGLMAFDSLFQAIRGISAVRSGIDSLPMTLSNVAGIILFGRLMTRLEYVARFFIMSSVIMSVGAGLITIFTVDVSQAKSYSSTASL
ncbi:hypothetical protein PENCOP_c011G06394 [Penicillium coprophilum]|uniref:Major facilitator superfamily (MFS) profile domain-containing protein n=1 Tax=Penicillium coprophilum TaxID=36646 RepID=A0A1V6UE78_9EURO|nr:hypothetical protein PENCOP_c011G06394 [Penicillium coprophilum]